MDSRAAVEHQDDFFVKSGWTDHFDQVNARGPVITTDQLIAHQIGRPLQDT